MMNPKQAVDATTFEILRHRLWEINDEMGLLARRLSGSPAVYETGDFNTAILTPDGHGLFIGVHIIRQGSVLDVVVQSVLQVFGDEIADGDAFLTTDPWAGALHAQDAAVVKPIFWQDQLVAWTGVVMHELDVGGPRPGSWSVGAQDAYQECPLLPPIKLVDRGSYRKDVEAAFLRNSRTPQINALNLRAKLVAQVATGERLREIIEQYGLDVFMGVQTRIVEYVRETVRQRLRGLRDGTYSATALVDHDGTLDKFYHLQLAMTKSDDHLVFDFSGTDRQAPGPINCTYAGLLSGVMQVLLPSLCYDVPWCQKAVGECVDIISEPGTLNNALWPAATTMSTTNACQSTGDLVWQTLTRMYGISESLRSEAIALGFGGVNAGFLAGTDAAGTRFVNLFTDSVGGGGARSFGDGIDVSANLVVPSHAIPNVERIESLVPVLYLYRRQCASTSGAGRYRGGAGLEMIVVPYGVKEPMEAVFISSGCAHPSTKGAFGGLPGSIQRNLILRQADVPKLLGTGFIPTTIDEIPCSAVDVPHAKDSVQLDPADAWLNFSTGGGGFGDPLLREPAMVAADVVSGIYEVEAAATLYGVSLDDDGNVDLDETRRRRAGIRRHRIDIGRPPKVQPREARERDDQDVGIPEICLVVRSEGDEDCFACAWCSSILGPVILDVRNYMITVEHKLSSLSPLNRLTTDDRVSVLAYCCPSCGTALTSDVRVLDDDSWPPEIELRARTGR